MFTAFCIVQEAVFFLIFLKKCTWLYLLMRSSICRGKNLEKGGEFMRKTFGKRMISVCVACLLMASTISFVAYADEAVPFYNNVYSVSSTASISSSGLLTVTNSYTGSSSVTTKAVITTYIERKTLGIFWSRVDIGQTNDEWVDTIYQQTKQIL